MYISHTYDLLFSLKTVFHLHRCIKSLVLRYEFIFHTITDRTGAPDASVDASELVHSCFCARGSVTSGRSVGGTRGEDGGKNPLSQWGPRVIRTCALFNDE